ncbi:MAG: hypothetical protein AAGF28_03655 [Pseudomonadota bacterium]
MIRLPMMTKAILSARRETFDFETSVGANAPGTVGESIIDFSMFLYAIRKRGWNRSYIDFTALPQEVQTHSSHSSRYIL